MVHELKKVSERELVVGQLYCDLPRINGFNAVVMEYVGKGKGAYEFKYVYGINEYINEGDDIIRLPWHNKEVSHFWEVDKESAECIAKLKS